MTCKTTETLQLQDIAEIVSSITDDDLIEASQSIYDLKQTNLNNIRIYIRQNIVYLEGDFTILYINNMYHNCMINGRVNEDSMYDIQSIEDIPITDFITYLYRHIQPNELTKVQRIIDIMYPLDQLYSAKTTTFNINDTEYTMQ